MRRALSWCLFCELQIEEEGYSLCGFPPRMVIIDEARPISGEFHKICALHLTGRQMLELTVAADARICLTVDEMLMENWW